MMDYGKTKKIIRWKSALWLDKIDLLILTCWYRLVWLDDLTCLIIICKSENTWLIRAQNFANFVRFRPHIYTRTQQSLSPVSLAAIISLFNFCSILHINWLLLTLVAPISVVCLWLKIRKKECWNSFLNFV